MDCSNHKKMPSIQLSPPIERAHDPHLLLPSSPHEFARASSQPAPPSRGLLRCRRTPSSRFLRRRHALSRRLLHHRRAPSCALLRCRRAPSRGPSAPPARPIPPPSSSSACPSCGLRHHLPSHSTLPRSSTSLPRSRPPRPRRLHQRRARTSLPLPPPSSPVAGFPSADARPISPIPGSARGIPRSQRPQGPALP